MITCDKLSAIPQISHGFFGRIGGVSTGIYNALNCGAGSDDTAENVQQNRRIVEQQLGVDDGHLISVHQIHSATALIIDNMAEYNNKLPEADAMVTNKPNIALGVLTADCVPVLFADAHNNVIGAAHAGWKGAIAGITTATIKKMEALSAEKKHITATIGPAIGQRSYEVDEKFYQQFLAEDPENNLFFHAGKQAGKYQFNIKAYVAHCLASDGIEHIQIMANDTCAEADKFFSNRRRNLQGEPDYGRQVSAIMLKNESKDA